MRHWRVPTSCLSDDGFRNPPEGILPGMSGCPCLGSLSPDSLDPVTWSVLNFKSRLALSQGSSEVLLSDSILHFRIDQDLRSSRELLHLCLPHPVLTHAVLKSCPLHMSCTASSVSRLGPSLLASWLKLEIINENCWPQLSAHGRDWEDVSYGLLSLHGTLSHLWKMSDFCGTDIFSYGNSF